MKNMMGPLKISEKYQKRRISELENCTRFPNSTQKPVVYQDDFRQHPYARARKNSRILGIEDLCWESKQNAASNMTGRPNMTGR